MSLPPSPTATLALTPARLAQVMEATWPAARSFREGPFTIRDGQGGGKRVSAATLDVGLAAQDPALADLERAEAAMDALGQERLFLLTPGQDALDRALAARGYQVIDPVVAYAAPARDLAQPTLPLSTFEHWPPLAAAAEIWAEGGIGPARLAVMARVPGAHIALLARSADDCSGAGFVAMAGNVAMLHALEVAPAHRRKGAGRHLLQAAALWAERQGADTLSLVVTRDNQPARALYASLGMQVVGQYHYRQSRAGGAALK